MQLGEKLYISVAVRAWRLSWLAQAPQTSFHCSELCPGVQDNDSLYRLFYAAAAL